MSSAQPRTSCTKRSWWTTRMCSTRRAAVERRQRRRPSSPPDGGHPGSLHSLCRSLMWRCTRPTATAGCRMSKGRKGCRTAAPADRYVAVGPPSFSRSYRYRRTSSGSRARAYTRAFCGEIARRLSAKRTQLSNLPWTWFRESQRCYFLPGAGDDGRAVCYLAVCAYCFWLYVTQCFGDEAAHRYSVHRRKSRALEQFRAGRYTARCLKTLSKIGVASSYFTFTAFDDRGIRDEVGVQRIAAANRPVSLLRIHSGIHVVGYDAKIHVERHLMSSVME